MQKKSGRGIAVKQKANPGLTVVNVVATAELAEMVDLYALAIADGFHYDTMIYHCAYLKDEKTVEKVSIFATGKMISVGAKTLDAAGHDLRYAANRLVEIGLVSRSDLEIRVRNIVATTTYIA